MHLAIILQPGTLQCIITTSSLQEAALFTKGEYEQRLTRLRSYMSEHKLEACVFTSYHNINYYSGFVFCHFGRFYSVVVTHDDEITLSAGDKLFYLNCLYHTKTSFLYAKIVVILIWYHTV